MKRRGSVFVLSGASGCGKSTLLSALLANPEAGTYCLESAPKYSTRTRRENDPNDDIIHVPEITSSEFDFPYFLNDTTYAIKTDEIEARISEGRNLLVILSDFRVVHRLKQRFPNETIAIYVSSAIDPSKLAVIQQQRRRFIPDNEQRRTLTECFTRLQSGASLDLWERVYKDAVQFGDTWKQFMPESHSTEIRQEKIRQFHTRYIDNISIFDHVVLNYVEGKINDMVEQALSIIKYYSLNPKRVPAHPPVFVICAASGMGKGTLMELVNLIGGKTIRIANKVGARDPKNNDKSDGMVALGKGSQLPPEYDVRWVYHKNIPYGISSAQVHRSIQEGVAQVFVANMDQIERLRSIFGSNVSFVYLHRTTTREEMKSFQSDLHINSPEQVAIRLEEVDKVYSEYLKRIAEFDHVLLNTRYKEDLFAQMLQIIDSHSNV